MSRQRRALISAFFTYCQWALSIGTSLVMARVVIRGLGEGMYGLWLAASGLLGYAALSDLGLLTILPWLVATADGRKDEAEIRGLTTRGFALGALVGALFAAVAGALWVAAPALLKASPAERELVFVPFATLVALTALGYPLRAAGGVLKGLQDVTFAGALAALQPAANLGLVLVFLHRGQGMLGLALGAALPLLLVGLAFLWRLWRRHPHLLRGWEGLRRDRLSALVSGGLGAWLSSLGWQLAFSSDAVILAFLGARDAVTVFAITSRPKSERPALDRSRQPSPARLRLL
jgi:O-antigen/teichoic acid export membrane protein